MDINVTCEASKRLSVEELLEFQGELKTLHVKSYNRLKNSIMKYGFAFPMFIWKGKNYLLDGHQRLRVIKNESFNIGFFSVSFICLFYSELTFFYFNLLQLQSFPLLVLPNITATLKDHLLTHPFLIQ